MRLDVIYKQSQISAIKNIEALSLLLDLQKKKIWRKTKREYYIDFILLNPHTNALPFSGIPTFVLLDEERDIITKNGRGAVNSDKDGKVAGRPELLVSLYLDRTWLRYIEHTFTRLKTHDRNFVSLYFDINSIGTLSVCLLD